MGKIVRRRISLTDAEQEAIAGVRMRVESGWRESALAHIREVEEEKRVPAEIERAKEAARQQRQEAHKTSALQSGIGALILTLIGAVGYGGPGLLLFVFFLMLWLPIFAIVDLNAMLELRKQRESKIRRIKAVPHQRLRQDQIAARRRVQENTETLSAYLVREGWELAPSQTRLPAPPHLYGRDELLPIAHRARPWGSELFVEIQRQPDVAYAYYEDSEESYTGWRRMNSPETSTCWGIFTVIDGTRSGTWDTDEYVDVIPEPKGKDDSDDLDLESQEFNEKWRVACSSGRYAYRVLAPNVMDLLIDTYNYPDELFNEEVASPTDFLLVTGSAAYPLSTYRGELIGSFAEYSHRFEYHIEPSSVLVSRHHQGGRPHNPIWTQRDEFIFLEAQFNRFFATLPGGLTGGR
jgi:hypothetical protein